MKKKRLLLTIIIFIMVIVFPLYSQTTKTVEPTLIAQEDSRKVPMQLTRFSVHVTINGLIAETKTTMTFYNPHSRDMEAELVFPLPEGSFISGYALDIEGVMVDGVVVEKEKGRIAFEQISRKKVDPGLVEWVSGNNFRTRIYPVPTRGSRTISIRYISEITTKNKKAFYHLPLQFSKPIRNFSILVQTLNDKNAPVIQGEGLENFGFNSWQSGFKAETFLENFKAKNDLVLLIPQETTETIRIEKSNANEYYFSFHPTIPLPYRDEKKLKLSPKHISILWDGSGSMEKSDHKKELQLLKAFLETLLKQNHKKITVDLIVFHHLREKPVSFTLDKLGIDRLILLIEEIGYDGGTSLSALSPEKEERTPDFYLLFSDGNSNFGKSEPSGFQAPVYAISSSSSANHTGLRYIASQTGGNYFNLNRVSQDYVIRNIGFSPYSFLSYKIEKGSVSEIFPRPVEPVMEGFSIVGKLTSPTARIKLQFGIRGKILKSTVLKLSRKKAALGDLLRTFWAQKKISDLMVFPDKNKKELTEIGKQYGIVTPGTSLIVLENLEQYLQYKIMPPVSLKEMREKYLEEIKNRKFEEEQDKKDKLEEMVELWNNHIQWWEKTFTPAEITPPKTVVPVTAPVQQSVPEPRPQQSAPTPSPLLNCTNCIYGRIKLADDSPIPGTTVTLIPQNGGSSQIILSGYSGNYAFNNVNPGFYSIKAELEGFKTLIRRDLKLLEGQQVKTDIQMEPSALLEQVVVCGSVPTVDVTSSHAAMNIDGMDTNAPLASVSINEWNPDTPYLEKIKQAATNSKYSVYLSLRKQYETTPAFYLDCAGYFFKIGDREHGLRILSNIAEMELENFALLRVLAHRLAQLNYLELSAGIFEKVLELRREEPQSYRDLALVLERQKKYPQALDLLYHVVITEWDDRFDGIELVSLMEINHLLNNAPKNGIINLEKKIDPRFIKIMDVDVRITLTWDADNTDMDLWVTDPAGEKTYYGHKLSRYGGTIPFDFTGGYGPEVFAIKKAPKGEYQIQVNYYGSASTNLLGPVTIQVEVFTNYNRKSETRQFLTIQLSKEKGEFDVGKIKF